MLHATPLPSSTPGAPPMPRAIRVLLLDDSNFDRARIRRLSEKTKLSVHMDEVDSIIALDEAVARENYDLILIDYRLPVGDGMEALNHVLQNDQNKDAGKIMISGDGARSTAVRAMRNGYHDFLNKEEMDAEALREAMIGAMSMARARQEILLQVELQRKLIRDGLVAALKDSEVQGNVISMVQQRLAKAGLLNAQMRDYIDASDVDGVLAGMADEDEFIFH